MRETWLNFGHERDKEPAACRYARELPRQEERRGLTIRKHDRTG